MLKMSEFAKLTDEDNNNLKQNYIKKLDDRNFRELINTLNVDENLLMKYTSSLEESAKEFANCRKCPSRDKCKNEIKGYMYSPKVDDNKITFSYVACAYEEKHLRDIKYRENVLLFEVPKKISEASLKDLYKDDKNRTEIIKYFKKFTEGYGKEFIKGMYLYGSFGCGKTYLIAALFNEFAKKDIKSAIVYVPEFLRALKSSFGTNFEEKYDYIKKVPLLLLDDIGAENLTPWARDEILGTILQYRMDQNLPTFFTSNLSLKQIEEHFTVTSNGKETIKGRRIIERINFLSEEFELTSKNRRS